MRIVFIGTVQFSREMLSHLISMGADVQGVCTATEPRSNSDYADLSDLCRQLHIPLLRTQDINSDEAIFWISELKPDVIFCFGWSRLIGKRLLDLPHMGIVGYHPAELPKNRGRHPLIWALALGLNRTASTFFFMNEGADSGDILSQVQVEIDFDDDARSLYSKLVATAKTQLSQVVKRLDSGIIVRRKQDDLSATYWRKRTAKDGRIDWRMGARDIHNLVRALASPYPGADFEAKNIIFKVWKSQVIVGVPLNAEPGKVIGFMQGQPIVRCGTDAICLIDTTPFFEPSLGDYL